MNVLMGILMVVMALVGIVLIASVLLQQPKSEGMGALGGVADSFFSKNKSKSWEGKLALVTKISSVSLLVLSLGLVILEKFF